MFIGIDTHGKKLISGVWLTLIIDIKMTIDLPNFSGFLLLNMKIYIHFILNMKYMHLFYVMLILY